MFNRIKFKWNFKKNYPFKYDSSNGNGIAPIEYSIFKDKVRYRTSKFGCVNGYSFYGRWSSREQFLEIYNPKPIDSK